VSEKLFKYSSSKKIGVAKAILLLGNVANRNKLDDILAQKVLLFRQKPFSHLIYL